MLSKSEVQAIAESTEGAIERGQYLTADLHIRALVSTCEALAAWIERGYKVGYYDFVEAEQLLAAWHATEGTDAE